MTATPLAAERTARIPRPTARTGLTLVLLLVGAGALAAPPIAAALLGSTSYDTLSRSYPGPLTAITAAGLRGVVDLAALVTAGAIAWVLVLEPSSGKRWDRLAPSLGMRIGRIAALTWAGAATALIAFDAADANGLPISVLTEQGALGYLVDAAYLPKAWLLVAPLTVVTYFTLALASRWRTVLLAVGTTAAAILAPTVIGQLLVGPNHDIGSDSGIVLGVTSLPVLGAVVVAAIRLAAGERLAPVAARRLGILVTWGAPIALAAELGIAWFKVVAPGGFDTPTAALQLVRILLLLAVVVGMLVVRRRWHRRPTAALIDRAVMLGTVLTAASAAVALVMLRIPPPQYFGGFDAAIVLLGFQVDAAPTAATLATAWRPNVLFATMSLTAIVVYLVAVRTLRRRGDAWPVQRTICWILGWATIALTTSSGLGRYSGADFAVHMGVHMLLNMLGPILIVLGGAITLMLRALPVRERGAPAGPHEWLVAALHWPVARAIQHPIVVFVLFVGSYYALYLTPLYGEAMRYHWAHQLMNLHFIITGILFYGLIIGVDRPAKPLPHIAKLGMTLAAMPFHAFFAVIIMTSDTVVAEEFYQYLGLPWMTDLLEKQRIAGGIAWAGSEIPLIIVIGALARQWAKADARDAKRIDRQLDAGRDDDFDDYNTMLQRLTDRRAAAEQDRA